MIYLISKFYDDESIRIRITKLETKLMKDFKYSFRTHDEYWDPLCLDNGAEDELIKRAVKSWMRINEVKVIPDDDARWFFILLCKEVKIN